MSGQLAGFASVVAQAAADIQKTKQNIAVAKQEAKASSQIGEFNARLAEQQAGLAEKRGALTEEESRTRSKLALGTIRARVGKSGVLLEGSPLESFLESVKQAELDALNKRFGGELEAFSFRQRAGIERVQAGLEKQVKRQEAKLTRARIPNIFLAGLTKGLSNVLTK